MKTQSTNSKPEVLRYVATNGLLATGVDLSKPTLCRVLFAIMDNDEVHVTVQSARNSATMHKLGKKIITRDQLRDMPEDAYNDFVFDKAAFQLMNLRVG